MPAFRTRPTALLPAALLPLLFVLLPTPTSAHGDHSQIEDGQPISAEPIDAILWTHILLQCLAWGLLFPTGLVLGLVRSRLHVPIQVFASLVAIVAYFLGHLHKGRQFGPNAHAKFANLIMLIWFVQVLIGVYLKLHLTRGLLGRLRPLLVRTHLVCGAFLPVIAWTQMLLGGIASQGFCQGDHLGQCLAHFIMGSAFVAYGILLTIILLCGQAWLARSRRSQEFWDSCIIAAWGVVNTFTEHRWGTAWANNDLQHTSMGIIWWAAGLVGIWLSRDRRGRPRRNLIPALVIFMTGWGMSGHPQELPVSTQVHAVFGYTLMAAGVTRIIEISFVTQDRTPSLKQGDDGDEDEDADIHSFQYIPPFLLYASGFLFMGATEEQMQILHDAHVTHVSYVLILFSIAFLMFLCMFRNPHSPPTQIGCDCG